MYLQFLFHLHNLHLENENVRCPALSSPLNGRIAYSKVFLNGGYPLETTATLECDHGYSKVENNNQICQYPRNWLDGGSEGYRSGKTSICEQGDETINISLIVMIFIISINSTVQNIGGLSDMLTCNKW